MRISDVMVAANYMIVCGTNFLFTCWGDSTYIIDFENEFGAASAIFDTKTSEVYEVTVNADVNGEVVACRWLNPSYKDMYLQECEVNNVNCNVAWDNVKWEDLNSEKDILDKIRVVLKNEF